MYAKLALSNARKSIRDYVIYFVTLIICVSMFYAFLSLSSSHYELITEDTYNFEYLKIMLKYATYIITGLLIVLIAYVNKYMIKRRKREFATYILLGIPQRNVAFMFFIETLVMGMISIAFGIFLGTLFSQLVTALILMTANQEIIFSFKLYLDTIAITLLFFSLMFCIIGLINVRTLSKSKLINMLNDEKKTEFQFKRGKSIYISVFIAAILFYILCGFSVHKILLVVGNPDLKQGNEITYFGIAIISFIIGTYTLFYSLSYVLILIKERWIKFKYEYTNLFLIGAVVSKIKTAPMLMATISLTFLGAALCFTLTLLLSQWSLGYLDNRIPFDTIVANKLNIMSSEEDISKIDYSGLVKKLENENFDIKDYCEVEQYYIYDKKLYDTDVKNMPLFAISLGDYNHLRKMLGFSEVQLGDNEFTTQWLKLVDDSLLNDYISENSTLKINDKEFKLSSNPYYKDSIGEYIYNSREGGLVVLPDELCKSLTLAAKDFYAKSTSKVSNDALVKIERDIIPKWFMENHSNMLSNKNKNNPLTIRLKAAETNEILNVTLGMRILGIYGGAVLLMISLTVLALQQLSDSIEHKGRFNTLRKLGIDNKEIGRLILKQISLYFTLPIIVAVFGFYIFFNAFQTASKTIIDIYIGGKAFMFNISISLFLIIVIYVCYFVATYYSFKRNVDVR
ncbi:FtsX-like permease family protein [Clostridium intestinale]|uniref:Putative ABC transport system permease protein n=1 Tax=Clostridium intestinale DSM 6191 TaxID=1121320 RepID=A0A1M5UJ65_9CLOT|nr:ABC transporter permease [Clostridium intestinale]SHH63122.1 putative ABC transport system permease protein [Clostridium intestinale DSM 6191]